MRFKKSNAFLHGWLIWVSIQGDTYYLSPWAKIKSMKIIFLHYWFINYGVLPTLRWYHALTTNSKTKARTKLGVGWKWPPQAHHCPEVIWKFQHLSKVVWALVRSFSPIWEGGGSLSFSRALKFHGTSWMKTAGEAPQVAPKKRPMRLAARRQRELMCQILRDSDVEWINED